MGANLSPEMPEFAITDQFWLPSCDAQANANSDCNPWLAARTAAGNATTAGSVAAPHFTQRTSRIADLVRLAVPFGALLLVVTYDLISACCLWY